MAKRMKLTPNECYVLSEGLGEMEVPSRDLWGIHEGTIDRLDTHRRPETVVVRVEDGRPVHEERKTFQGDVFVVFEKAELQRCNACLDWYATKGVKGAATKPLRLLGVKIAAALKSYDDTPAKRKAKRTAAKKKPKKKKARRR